VCERPTVYSRCCVHFAPFKKKLCSSRRGHQTVFHPFFLTTHTLSLKGQAFPHSLPHSLPPARPPHPHPHTRKAFTMKCVIKFALLSGLVALAAAAPMAGQAVVGAAAVDAMAAVNTATEDDNVTETPDVVTTTDAPPVDNEKPEEVETFENSTEVFANASAAHGPCKDACTPKIDVKASVIEAYKRHRAQVCVHANTLGASHPLCAFLLPRVCGREDEQVQHRFVATCHLPLATCHPCWSR
jgi:hypothetical protein